METIGHPCSRLKIYNLRVWTCTVNRVLHHHELKGEKKPLLQSPDWSLQLISTGQRSNLDINYKQIFIDKKMTLRENNPVGHIMIVSLQYSITHRPAFFLSHFLFLPVYDLLHKLITKAWGSDGQRKKKKKSRCGQMIGPKCVTLFRANFILLLKYPTSSSTAKSLTMFLWFSFFSTSNSLIWTSSGRRKLRLLKTLTA